MTHRPHETRGWLFYDDSCGFCQRWVRAWGPSLARRGFEITPLQSEFARGRLQLSDAERLRDIRLLLASGQLIEGADAYRHLMRHIYCAYPFYLLSKLPILSSAFNWAYRTFANHRHRFSKACGLPPGTAGKKPRT